MKESARGLIGLVLVLVLLLASIAGVAVIAQPSYHVYEYEYSFNQQYNGDVSSDAVIYGQSDQTWNGYQMFKELVLGEERSGIIITKSKSVDETELLVSGFKWSSSDSVSDQMIQRTIDAEYLVADGQYYVSQTSVEYQGKYSMFSWTVINQQVLVPFWVNVMGWLIMFTFFTLIVVVLAVINVGRDYT